MSGSHNFAAHQGWLGLSPAGIPSPIVGGLGPLDTSLPWLLGPISEQAHGHPNASLQDLLDKLAASLPDDFAQQLADHFASTIYSNRTNVITGEKIEIGKMGADVSGKARLSYDGADGLIPGMAASLDFLGVTRRLRFNSVKDIQVSLLLDSDAALKKRYGKLLSGVTVKKPVRIRGAAEATLTITAGRDESGGPAFSFALSATF